MFQGDVGPSGPRGLPGETGYGLPGPKVTLSVNLCSTQTHVSHVCTLQPSLQVTFSTSASTLLQLNNLMSAMHEGGHFSASSHKRTIRYLQSSNHNAIVSVFVVTSDQKMLQHVVQTLPCSDLLHHPTQEHSKQQGASVSLWPHSTPLSLEHASVNHTVSSGGMIDLYVFAGCRVTAEKRVRLVRSGRRETATLAPW